MFLLHKPYIVYILIIIIGAFLLTGELTSAVDTHVVNPIITALQIK